MFLCKVKVECETISRHVDIEAHVCTSNCKLLTSLDILLTSTHKVSRTIRFTGVKVSKNQKKNMKKTKKTSKMFKKLEIAKKINRI